MDSHGYQATYISGGALSNSHGLPDTGLLGLDKFCSAIKDISQASRLPVLCDADTGFADPRMTVFEYNHAGAAGLHIEDQTSDKRCGHLDNKTLISVDAMKAKVQACARARDDFSNSEFIICARTDAREVEGLQQVVDRARHYMDAGADMIFPEGLANLDEFAVVADKLRQHNPDVFLLANMTEFGKTENIAHSEFAAAGYSCIIYPVSTQRVAMKAIDGFLSNLKTTGSADESLPKMQTRDELYKVLNYTPGQDWLFPSRATTEQRST